MNCSLSKVAATGRLLSKFKMQVVPILLFLGSGAIANSYTCYCDPTPADRAACAGWCQIQATGLGDSCNVVDLSRPIDWDAIQTNCLAQTGCNFITHSGTFSSAPGRSAAEFCSSCLGGTCTSVRSDSCFGTSSRTVKESLQKMHTDGQMGKYGLGNRCLTLHQTFCGMTYSAPTAPWGGISTAVKFCVDCEANSTNPSTLISEPLAPAKKPMKCTAVATLPTCGATNPSMLRCYSQGQTALCDGTISINEDGALTTSGVDAEICCKNPLTGRNSFSPCSSGDPSSCSCPNAPDCSSVTGQSCDGYGATAARPDAPTLRPYPHSECEDSSGTKVRLCCKEPGSDPGKERPYGGTPNGGVWALEEECEDIIECRNREFQHHRFNIPFTPIGPRRRLGPTMLGDPLLDFTP